MAEVYKIHTGQVLDKEGLVSKLKEMNYRRQEFVSRPGDYATRGNTVDIYPFTYQLPVRITFHIDEVESIRDFSLESGETMLSFAELNLIPISQAFEKKLGTYEKYLQERAPMASFYDIKEGDFVVHIDYGVGRFLGFKRLKIKGEFKRHYVIEYAQNELLYVDAAQAKLIERYIGLEGKKPKLNKLNTKDWQKTKEKTRLAVKSVAHDMLELQAKRNTMKGFAYRGDTEWQKQFEEEFPFEETPDQLKATSEVKSDMESSKPMDRLLCGDVGYGKTEVAMRAAFKAVMDNKQVAFLVPTTILAEQHYLTLRERVKSFPITVASLSRFRSHSEQKKIVEAVRSGNVDIVIGTHRLLSKDVQFKELGLVVIDEEQRFGVKHKEKLKHLRELVDVLTLTATPIPRTLYMSLIGARDMSVISTPPQGRMPIQTEIIEFDEDLVRRGIERELSRKGQVYFVHNRIESIEKIHRKLKELVPNARFAVAHGQMPAHMLERIMDKFIHAELDCLISTNIIESGLDIPNVNTIMVHRADTFGLADLYQLRGRVGRFAKRQAYAYFIVPKDFIMSGDAGKRMRAIERFTELGAGFKIAMEDLEIRGAGNILGEQQTGFIYQVGFDLYCKLLQQAIQEEEKKHKPQLKKAAS